MTYNLEWREYHGFVKPRLQCALAIAKLPKSRNAEAAFLTSPPENNPTAMAAAAAAEAPRASASSAENRLLQSLADRGWRFRDPADEAIQALLLASPTPSPEAVESELVDMDLRTFGGKSLPDRATTAATAKRLSYVHGPIVLQVPSEISKPPSPKLLHPLRICVRMRGEMPCLGYLLNPWLDLGRHYICDS